MLGSSQEIGGAEYEFSYSYNQASGLETQQYPSSLLVKTCYDSAGRIDEVSSTGTPSTTYASQYGYAPHGAVAELKLGNNLYEYRDYNNRLQPIEIGLGTFDGGSDKLKLEFNYGTARRNNGNVTKQIITRPGLTALTQSYTYDKVNRLKTVAESGAGTAWSRTYSYDIFGNRAVSANRGLPTSPLMPTASTGFSSATNRLTLTGASYDNAGNLTATSLGDTLVYDAFGKLAAEYSTAAPSSPGTFYRTPDHLGSTRLVTKQDQSDADCYDFAPFGEEIPDTLGSRSSNTCFAASFDGRHRFTGKERDEESDLDYFLARYYSGPMGRFLSVDPENAGADPEFPQSWNAYAYVANNPLAFVDPSGAITVCATEGDSTCTPSDDPEGIRFVVTVTGKDPEGFADPRQNSLQRAMMLAIASEVGKTAPLINALFIAATAVAGAPSRGAAALGLNLASKGATAPSSLAGVSALSKTLLDAGVRTSTRADVINSFRASTIKATTAGPNQTGLRFFGGKSPEVGYFLSPTFPTSRSVRSVLALPAGNIATGIAQFQIRQGAQFFSGTVAPNFGKPGGGVQFYVPNLKDLVRLQ